MRSAIQKKFFLKISLVLLGITSLLIFWGTAVERHALKPLVSRTYEVLFMNRVFRTACKNLNNKELTLSNLNSLGSRLSCYSSSGSGYSKCDDTFIGKARERGFAVYPYPGVTQWGCHISQKDNKITSQTLSPD